MALVNNPRATLPFARQKAAYWSLLYWLLAPTFLWINDFNDSSTMFHVFIGTFFGITICYVLLKFRSHKMIVIDGDHIMINTHLKSYELAPAEVKRVVRRSKNYVYFEKQDGEKIELEIRDFSEETLDRFIRVFQVVDEDKLTD